MEFIHRLWTFYSNALIFNSPYPVMLGRNSSTHPNPTHKNHPRGKWWWCSLRGQSPFHHRDVNEILYLGEFTLGIYSLQQDSFTTEECGCPRSLWRESLSAWPQKAGRETVTDEGCTCSPVLHHALLCAAGDIEIWDDQKKVFLEQHVVPRATVESQRAYMCNIFYFLTN